MTDMENAEVLNTFFAIVFNSNQASHISWVSELLGKLGDQSPSHCLILPKRNLYSPFQPKTSYNSVIWLRSISQKMGSQKCFLTISSILNLMVYHSVCRFLCSRIIITICKIFSWPSNFIFLGLSWNPVFQALFWHSIKLFYQFILTH